MGKLSPRVRTTSHLRAWSGRHQDRAPARGGDLLAARTLLRQDQQLIWGQKGHPLCPGAPQEPGHGLHQAEVGPLSRTCPLSCLS